APEGRRQPEPADPAVDLHLDLGPAPVEVPVPVRHPHPDPVGVPTGFPGADLHGCVLASRFGSPPEAKCRGVSTFAGRTARRDTPFPEKGAVCGFSLLRVHRTADTGQGLGAGRPGAPRRPGPTGPRRRRTTTCCSPSAASPNRGTPMSDTPGPHCDL